MVTTLAAVALIGTAWLAAWVFFQTNEATARTTYELIDRARLLIGLLFLALIAYHLISTGRLIYIFLAFLGFMFLALYILIEQPHKEVI